MEEENVNYCDDCGLIVCDSDAWDICNSGCYDTGVCDITDQLWCQCNEDLDEKVECIEEAESSEDLAGCLEGEVPQPDPSQLLESIKKRAYEIYQERIKMKAPGDQLSDWLRAEREIKAMNAA